MTTATTYNALCYCTALIEVLAHKEVNTEAAEYHLAVLGPS